MEREETIPSMPLPDDIHHSITDADDMEQVWDERIEVADVLKNLLQHPMQMVTRWNWKAAFIGAVLRASFYYTVYQASRQSWIVTLTAVSVELIFRFLTTGLAGAVVQSFRKATPLWQANIIMSIALPAFSHGVEFLTHYAQERYFFDIFASSDGVARQRAFAISVLFSVVSVLFNLFAMRHGVLLVGAGEETQTLTEDVKKLPRMIGEFTAFLPVQIARFLETGKLLNAALYFGTFGVTVGAILGIFRGWRWQWAWTSTLGAWACLLFATVLTLVVRLIMRRQGKVYHNRY